jgi:hypothetical protein
MVRFGPKSLPFGFAISVVFFFGLEFIRVPAGYYALSAALMIGAYVILRSSLRSSTIYRLPAGTSVC